MLGIKEQKIEDYDWKNKYRICQSDWASLYQVLDLKTGIYVAIKEYRTSEYSPEIQAQFQAQFAAVSSVAGQCILKVLKTFSFVSFSYIIYELCETNLKNYLSKRDKHLPEQEIGRITSHIARGMHSIIENKCIHGNLNPTNILHTHNVWKLSDFTGPIPCNQLEVSGEPFRHRKFRYIAPEVIIEQSQPTIKSDVWSFGIILYEMALGSHPFSKSDIDSYKKLVNKNIEYPSQLQINPKLRSLIDSCLKRLPEDRISWSDIQKHSFLLPFMKEKIVVSETKEKDILSILDNLQQSALLQLGSAESVQEFTQGKLEWNGITMVPNKLLKYDQFKSLCLALNHKIDPIEIRLLYRWIDTSEDGYINQGEFANFLSSSQFGNVLKNFFDSLDVKIKNKKIDAQQLFRNYDSNRSGTLDEKQIRQIVNILIPEFSTAYLSLIIDHIKKRFNGNIPIQTFYHQYQLRTGDEEEPHQKSSEVMEELISFKNQLKEYQITIDQIVNNFDRNKNDKLDFQQFKKMVISIGEFVREKQLKMMFDEVDKDHSGHISVAELEKFFHSKQ